MKIGIIGTGNMGQALGLRWARVGHDVLFGSRDLSKAETIAASGPDSTQAGDFDSAAPSATWSFTPCVMCFHRAYWASRRRSLARS